MLRITTRLSSALAFALVLSRASHVLAQDAFDSEIHGSTDASGAAVPAPASAQPPVDPLAAEQAAVTAPAPTAAAAADEDASPAQDENPLATADRARAQSTWQGTSGGVHLVDAASGLPGSVRLQLGFDYFRGSDFLFEGDTNEALAGTLSLAVAPADRLELFATFVTRGNSNNAGQPVLIQIVGDMLLGVKGFTALEPWLGLGMDLRAQLSNEVGDLGIGWAGTSVGARLDATADLRRIEDPLPLIFRGNLDYYFDNSSELIADVEEARYRALPPASRRARINEDRNLITRIERLALGVNRVDMLSFALGAEAPLQAADEFFINPLLEWSIGIPVNRQGYNCLSVSTDAGPSGSDGCLAVQGTAAAPSVLTLGARVLPPVRGLSALLAFDIGLRGTSTFVRELAPTKPWSLLLAVSLATDNRPSSSAAVVTLSKAPEPVRARIRGVVVDAKNGAPIADAAVRYARPGLNPQLSADNGEFISYELEPGEVSVEVSHPAFETRTCNAVIPVSPAAASGDATATTVAPISSGLAPVTSSSPDGSVASAAPPPEPENPAQSEWYVPLRCELTARAPSAAPVVEAPKVTTGKLAGSLTGDAGAPVKGVPITVSGPTLVSAQSDVRGTFSVADLPAGDYTVRVEAPGYLPASVPITITAGQESQLPITLNKATPAAAPAPAPAPEPAKPSLVTLTSREVRIRKQVMFKPGSSEIDARSEPLLQQIADVLIQNPQVVHVQVQGHTDNKGEPSQNLALSQARAESVVAALVAKGVESSRLEAKGFGDTRPLVPNLTPGNRAQNRRVQLIIK